MNVYNLTYKPYGTSAILIEWPKEINKNILKNILDFKRTLSNNYIKVKVEIITTYNSLTIFYALGIENIYNEISTLKELYNGQDTQNKINTRLWKIPVCYDQKFGIDLEEISLKNSLTKSEIITLHTNRKYLVYFIGFLPGFLYLGGLDKKLYVPRKENPRLYVERGAVAIGGEQTGVYPQESSGGWNIIGNSPISFFDRKSAKPCFAEAGDMIEFIPIAIEDHKEISSLVSYKRYKIESKEIDA